MNNIILRIFVFTFLPYMISILFIFTFQNIPKVRNNQEEKKIIYSFNYFILLDFRGFLSKIREYINNQNLLTLTDLYNDYIVTFDIYGNPEIAKKIENKHLINLHTDLNKFYSYAIFQEQNSNIEQNKVWITLFDFNLNPINSSKIIFNKNFKEISYLSNEKIGFLLSSESLNYLALYNFQYFKSSFKLQKKAEFNIKQNISCKYNQDAKFSIFHIFNDTQNIVILFDNDTYNQYYLSDTYPQNITTNDNNIFILAKKIIDNQQYLVKIPKNNIKYAFFYKIDNNWNYSLNYYNSYLIILKENSKSNDIYFLSEELNISKKIKISYTGDNFKLFTNINGIFLNFNYQSFPFIVKIDQTIAQKSNPYFSITTDNNFDLDIKFSFQQKMDNFNIFTKSNDIEIQEEKENLETQEYDLFIKFYQTF